MADKTPIDDLLRPIKEALVDAFNRGVQSERKRLSRMLAGEPDPTGAFGADNGKRVERGAVRDAVQKIVKTAPGLSKAEIVRQSQLPSSSVSNELERNDGKKGLKLYRHKGKRWYLALEAEETAHPTQEHRGPATEIARPQLNGTAG